MINLVVHATHEAGVKVGGIGAVLDGLLASHNYNNGVRRTILLGNYHADNGLEYERLRSPRNRFTVRYHAREGIAHVPDSVALAFHQVQQFHNVSILYGTRRIGQVEHEVLLVDGSHAATEPINDLKGFLYSRYGFQSSHFEDNPEFNQYMGDAVASINALYALLGHIEQPAIFIAHEWLGLPALFAAERHLPGQFRRVFYAHETATVRAIIETNNGHDLRFYNAMRIAQARGLSLEQVFGSYHDYFKHALLRIAVHLDGVFAVGDFVKEELEFLDPSLRQRRVDLVYNGVPSTRLSIEEKLRSKRLLQQYAQALHGFTPSWVFSHVTRLVPSKAIWRDIRVMEHLDFALRERGETAIFYILSSVRPTGRRSEDVFHWEWQYGWPVHHRADNGDLISYEWDYYQSVEQFNHYARASRIVFINQFGWSRDRCGNRMPAEMEFMDLRYGSDLEFGQSIYEPFGIAQVEPISFGALCLLSSACGCLGFIRDAGGMELPNVLEANYLHLPYWVDYWDLHGILSMGREARDRVEAMIAEQAAYQVIERLPRSNEALQTRLEQGYQLGSRMSWEVVAQDYLLPAFNRLL
ncbi:MAG: hypothetical protein H0T73_11465 [Ardenticatenales bacterium]|nr:hypothetical protein [Ardenticatenales bacterium]